jgi:hypothetical protein
MQSLGDIFQFAVVQGYPWKKLGQRTIVDVGGGQGNLYIALAEMYAHKFNTFNLSNVLIIIPTQPSRLQLCDSGSP